MSFFKSQLLNGYNNLFFAHQKTIPIFRIHVSMSSAQKSSQMNAFFYFDRREGHVEGKDHAAVDAAFPVTDALQDHVISCGKNQALATIHTIYCDIDNQLLYREPDCNKKRIEQVFTREEIRRLKVLGNNLCEELEIRNLLRLKFHTLDLITEDGSRFGALNFLDRSSFGYFNYIIKKFVRMKSTRRVDVSKDAIEVTS